MTKNEYLESQRGKTYSVIVAEQPTESVIGSIRGDDLRNVVAILASGLQYRLDNAPSLGDDFEKLRTALKTAFAYLTLPNYAINLSLAENQALLANAVAVGLVTAEESAMFNSLATYQRPLYNITREDCGNYFGNVWHELPNYTGRQLKIKVTTAMPEQTHVLVQSRDVYEDGTFGDWRHNTAIYGIQAAATYYGAIRAEGRQDVRWRCEYDGCEVS